MRVSSFVLLSLLFAVSANAGSFQIIETPAQQETRERMALPADPGSPVQVYDFGSDAKSLAPLDLVRVDWTVEVRALGRSTCYIEFNLYDAAGGLVSYSNANVAIPSHSNGFVTARGQDLLSHAEYRQATKSGATARCH